jgi:hypothetical protein
MHGKIHAKLFTGSMVGSGPTVFAVWSYCIANARPDEGSLVDLNPDSLAAIIGKVSPSEIQAAIDFLCSPDGRSRTPKCKGRRLVRKGPLTYFVVNLELYRLGDDGSEGRREYWARQKAAYRSKLKEKEQESPEKPNDYQGKCPGQSGTVRDSPGKNRTVLHTDADAYADAGTKAVSDQRLSPSSTTPPPRSNDERSIGLNRSSPSRSKEKEFMELLKNILGESEMARAGGHWRKD